MPDFRLEFDGWWVLLPIATIFAVGFIVGRFL